METNTLEDLNSWTYKSPMGGSSHDNHDVPPPQNLGPWAEAVQYAQAIITEVELFVGIYACVRMYRMQKQQFYQFEYVLNQRRRNLAYNVDGTSRTVPSLGGAGIGSNGPRQQTVLG